MAFQLSFCVKTTASRTTTVVQGSLLRSKPLCSHHKQIVRKHYHRSANHIASVQSRSNSDVQGHQFSDTLLLCNHKLLGSVYEPACGSASSSTCGKCNVVAGGNTRGDSHISHLSHPNGHQLSVNNEFVRDRDVRKKYDVYSSALLCNQRFGKKQTTVAGCSLSTITRYSPLVNLSPMDTNWIVLRSLHTSNFLCEESKSKLETTVKALKDEKQKAETAPGATIDDPPAVPVGQPITPPAAVPPVAKEKVTTKEQDQVASEGTVAVPPKKTISQKIIAEVKHYYHGFRLLFIDVRVGCRHLWKILNGKQLTRRERRQLVRTTADMFRLVPFSVFIIVPFMEFLLPVALKLFPSMLPSTFKHENKEQDKLRKRLKGKLEMAKFLQDTIEEIALERDSSSDKKVRDFKEFMKRVRSTGEQTSNEEILKYSKLFRDELTLDNLQHESLVALCKLLELQPIGTNNFLRFQLRMKLRQLEADDRMIQKEGLDSLAVWELQEACRARGMRALGVPVDRLKFQLQQWLDLHLNEEVPASLLLLSRALFLAETVLPPEEQLKKTISILPESTSEEAKVQISEIAGERIDHKAKAKVIKKEEELIREEEEEMKRLEKTKKEEKSKKEEELKKKEEELKKKEEEEKAREEESQRVIAEVESRLEEVEKREAAEAARYAAAEAEAIAASEAARQQEVLIDKAPVLEEKEAEVVEEKLEGISTKDLEEIEEILEHVAEEKMGIKMDQEDLQTLKEDVSDYQGNLENLKEVIVSSGGDDIHESKAAMRLGKRVGQMIAQMDDVVGQLHKEKDSLMEDIEVREVRIKRSPELKHDERQRQVVLDQILEKKSNLISINELVLGMKRLQKVSDDTKLQRIAQVLDEDEDGNIDIDDALKVIELLGRENVSVNSSHMTEILDLLRKEAILMEEKKAGENAQETEKSASGTQEEVAPREQEDQQKQ